MLKNLSNIYFWLSIFLYSLLILKSNGEYQLLISLNIFTMFSYSFILYIGSNMNRRYYQKKYLIIEVFLYTLLFIFFNNFISYYYNNDFWVFNKGDALFYHNEILKILSMPLDKAIDSYLEHMGIDDLGMILILYPLYYIVESNLILNLFYLFVGLITALSIFTISSNFMTKKYAYLSSISYSLASFVIYFHSIGLKESFLIMLIVLSFDFYYRYIKSKNIILLLISLLFIASIILFRPAIASMIIVAIGFGSLLSKQGGIGIKIIALFIILFLISISSILIPILEKYTIGGFDALIYARESEGMIKGGLPFTYAVNTLSQLFGPLPSLVSHKITLTFYAPSLIYRVLLSFPFWLGVWYIFKIKSYKLYPLVLFILFEMFSLTAILEGLELRKALPHLPIVFIIAFWFLDKYDTKSIVIKRKKRFQLFFKFIIFLLTFIILFWNFK